MKQYLIYTILSDIRVIIGGFDQKKSNHSSGQTTWLVSNGLPITVMFSCSSFRPVSLLGSTRCISSKMPPG